MAEMEDAAAAKAAAKKATLQHLSTGELSCSGEEVGAEPSSEGASFEPILIADVESESIVDGPGFRFSVYTQGCPHHCPECHNPQTHTFEGGVAVTPVQLLKLAQKSPLHKGITLTGGEPLCQAKALIPFARLAREAGYNIWIYSGYLYEQVFSLELPGTEHPPSSLGAQTKVPSCAQELLDLCDVLVEGPFLIEQRSLDLKWKGSKNQRVIDLNATRQAGEIVLFA